MSQQSAKMAAFHAERMQGLGGSDIAAALDRWVRGAVDNRKDEAMKSQMRMEFEARHGFEVCDDMDIQTSVAWDNWKEAWKAAIDHARYKANECADNNAYTPAQKRALGAWLQRVALTVEDETPNAKVTGAAPTNGERSDDL